MKRRIWNEPNLHKWLIRTRFYSDIEYIFCLRPSIRILSNIIGRQCLVDFSLIFCRFSFFHNDHLNCIPFFNPLNTIGTNVFFCGRLPFNYYSDENSFTITKYKNNAWSTTKHNIQTIRYANVEHTLKITLQNCLQSTFQFTQSLKQIFGQMFFYCLIFPVKICDRTEDQVPVPDFGWDKCLDFMGKKFPRTKNGWNLTFSFERQKKADYLR